MTRLTDDEFWARIFHPQVRVGVTRAQEILDERTLTLLDRQLSEPLCETPDCTETAIVGVYCRHTSLLLRLTCGMHRERWRAALRTSAVCARCRRRGPGADLFRWVRIFASRSTS